MELNISDSARQSANNWSWSGHTGDAIIDDAQRRLDAFRSMGIEKGKYLNVEASKTVDSGWII